MRTPLKLWWALIAGMLLWGAARGAEAGPPVMPDSRRPSVSTYDSAAAEAGVSDWGATTRSASLVHVTVRLENQRLRLLISLPPSIPAAQADTWFSSLADAMGWPGANLYSRAQAQAYLLRADVVGEGLTQNGLRLSGGFPLDVLQQQLRALTPLPALVAVRTVGDKEFSMKPKPEARTNSGGDWFHFYRLGPTAAPLAPISVQSVIPVRRLAAALTALLLWMFVPLVGCFILREHVKKLAEVEPMDRLHQYRRWLRGIMLASLAGMTVSFFTLALPLISFVPGRFSAVFPMLIWMPLLGGQLFGRLIGLPLERDAWPQRRSLPWYRMLTGELVGTAMVACIFFGIAAVTSTSRGSGLAGIPHVMLLAMGIPILSGCGFALWGWYKWNQRKKGLSAGDTEAPPEVLAAVQELTTRLEVPVERVVISPPVMTGGIVAMVVAVKDTTAVVSTELASALSPEQVAALVAATALVQPRTRRQKWQQGLLTTGMLLPVLALVPFSLLAATGSFRGFSSAMPLVMLVGPATMILSMLYTRRTRRLQEEADFRVAEATDQPRLLVDALKKQEEVTAATAGLDSRTAANSALLTQRRTRLQQRVGLD